MRTLRDVQIGETVKVAKLHGEGALRRRLMDMGLTNGAEVNCSERAKPGSA